MYAAAFIFEPGDYDEEFHSLDDRIHEAAESIGGFLGRESWQSADGSKVNATYYWTDKESLREFSTHPIHLEAKRQYRKWYRGFHVVISKVQRSYGDGNLPHITPNERKMSV